MNELVTLSIDGQTVSVPKGITIIEAAAHADIDIPHLCYFEGLPKTGSCRVCMVELEGTDGLVASCARKVQDGMVVLTKTERVLDARRFVLELIWSVHPGDCTTCEKSGACELQKYTYELDIEKGRFPLQREEYPVDTTNPLIERDHNLCILCGRCIRMCKSGGHYVLDFIKRGIATKVTTPLDRPLQESGCTFCGNCISVCPVSSLVEKQRRFRGREWEFKATKTVCSYCGCGCNLLLDTTSNQIVRARTGEKDSYLCVKGKFGWDYVLSEERLKTPLIRKNGSLKECSWDEALEHTARQLLKIKESRGPDALGGLISANRPNETLYLFGKFIRACLGTNSIDSSARLLGLPAISWFIRSLGSLDIVSSLSDIKEAATLLVLASDVTIDSPVAGIMIKKALKNGAKLITIDPRRTEIAGLSHLHLQPKAGTETALLNGIIKGILDEKLYDEESVAANCGNFKEFLEGFPEEDMKKKTGVAKEAIVEAGRLYGKNGRKGVIIFSPETSSLKTLLGITNLLMLTGRVRGGAFPSLLLSNLRGAFEAGALAEFYPGCNRAENAAVKSGLEDMWQTSLPDRPGLSAVEMIQAASTSLFGIYILGENPAVSFPDTANTVKRLSSLDFLVVQDIFLTETAKLADVVLPGVSLAESTGTITSADGRVQKIEAAIDPQVEPEWKVITRLSSTMGYRMKYNSEEDIAEEMKKVATFRPKAQEYRFDLPSCKQGEGTGTGELCEELSSEYQYRLMTGPTLFGFGDGSWTKRSKISLLESPETGYIGISPQDAGSLGATDGSQVSVSSRHGEITTTVKVQESLPAGLTFMPTHTPGYNNLTSSSLDPATKSPRFVLPAVKIILT